MVKLLRSFLIISLLSLLAFTFGGTLTVTSPTEGAFLGTNNSLRFNITGASVEVTVTAVVTGPAGTTTISDKFTPDTDGKINNSLALNFNNSSPEGDYTIQVSATEPGQSYAPSTVHVKVDVLAPKFLEVSPNDNQFVHGIVKIRANIRETNVKDWTVRVNGQDIPNNTGTGNTVAVDWDTTSIINDGNQSISIRVRDQANNETSKTINVTLDRIKPVITIAYPRSDTNIVPGSSITVLVDIVDASSGSVDVTGVDVIAKRIDGTYITRVARVSFKSSGSNSNRWTGRIRYQKGLLPSQFKLVATAIDKAGNLATAQETTVRVGRSR